MKCKGRQNVILKKKGYKINISLLTKRDLFFFNRNFLYFTIINVD